MASTKHQNIPKLPATPVDWPTELNKWADRIEEGRTVKLTAGEALAFKDVFYIKASDGKAYKATDNTNIDGIWYSTSTAINTTGYGQIAGIMTDGTWTWTVRAFLYCNTSGALTETAPTLRSRAVAYALSATEIVLFYPPMVPFPAGLASVNTTAVGTDADTSEKDLMTFSVPANSLNSDKKTIRVTAWGTVGANANTKRIRLYFGSTAIIDTTAQSANDKDWIIEATIIRTGSSAQDSIGEYNWPTIGSGVNFVTHTETDTGAIVIKVTGLNGTATANDVQCEGMIVEFLN
jgi:hypothetical protein